MPQPLTLPRREAAGDRTPSAFASGRSALLEPVLERGPVTEALRSPALPTGAPNASRPSAFDDRATPEARGYGAG